MTKVAIFAHVWGVPWCGFLLSPLKPSKFRVLPWIYPREIHDELATDKFFCCTVNQEEARYFSASIAAVHARGDCGRGGVPEFEGRSLRHGRDAGGLGGNAEQAVGMARDGINLNLGEGVADETSPPTGDLGQWEKGKKSGSVCQEVCN